MGWRRFFLFQRKHVEFFFVGVIFWLENLGCMMMVDAYDIPLFGPVVQVFWAMHFLRVSKHRTLQKGELFGCLES